MTRLHLSAQELADVMAGLHLTGAADVDPALMEPFTKVLWEYPVECNCYPVWADADIWVQVSHELEGVDDTLAERLFAELEWKLQG